MIKFDCDEKQQDYLFVANFCNAMGRKKVLANAWRYAKWLHRQRDCKTDDYTDAWYLIDSWLDFTTPKIVRSHNAMIEKIKAICFEENRSHRHGFRFNHTLSQSILLENIYYRAPNAFNNKCF